MENVLQEINRQYELWRRVWWRRRATIMRLFRLVMLFWPMMSFTVLWRQVTLFGRRVWLNIRRGRLSWRLVPTVTRRLWLLRRRLRRRSFSSWRFWCWSA